MDTLITFVMQLLQTLRWFRRRRAVGFDRAEGAISARFESNCPSSLKSSRSLQKLHDKVDEGVQCPYCRWWNFFSKISDNFSADPWTGSSSLNFTTTISCRLRIRWWSGWVGEYGVWIRSMLSRTRSGSLTDKGNPVRAKRRVTAPQSPCPSLFGSYNLVFLTFRRIGALVWILRPPSLSRPHLPSVLGEGTAGSFCLQIRLSC